MYYRRALKLQAFLDMASESGKCVLAFSPVTFGQAWYLRPQLFFSFFFFFFFFIYLFIIIIFFLMFAFTVY
jgi:hypothetical protein